jgi:hypothetical protein
MHLSWTAGSFLLPLMLPNLCPHTRYRTQVWHLRLTLHFLADAGNMLDCACLAGIVALKHFRRPDVEVIGDEVTVVCPRPRLVILCLHKSPLARPFRTCARSVSHPPHTILPHLCILPRPRNTSNLRPIQTGTKTECRSPIGRLERAA